MKQTVKLNSKCSGYYWIDGDPGHWEYVTGKVIGISSKVLVDNVGSGYLACKVLIKTSEGSRIAYILQGSNKCNNDKNQMTFIGVNVGRLPKFRDGKIMGGCSSKVLIV